MKDLITETAALEAVLVTDTGFAPDAGIETLDIAPDADLETLDLSAPAISIGFASSADGRGFTTARRLRLRGYEGRLIASGHVLADQYTMARRCGFDAVRIGPDLAARQPEDQWLARADWQARDHRSRLRSA